MTPEAGVSVAPAHWHALDPLGVLQRVRSDGTQGLTRDAAARHLAEHGPNTLPEAEHRPLWRVLLRQFAAVIAFAMDHRGDSVVILIVVVLNAVIGTVQEGRAERSMEALRRLSALKVRVVRGGHEEIIEAHDLVPGDLVLR